MTFKKYKHFIYSDLYRNVGNKKLSSLIWNIFLGGSYKYNFWMRTCAYTKKHSIFKIILYPISKLILIHFRYKFGIDISENTQIGSGFYIGHFGCIVVNSSSKIGKNCNISQGVTIGQANRGKNKGYATLGDNVYIGPGAKIVGAVTIGNNVAIGANCVVTKDIPDYSVVVGIPGKVISKNGVEGYIELIDYE